MLLAWEAHGSVNGFLAIVRVMDLRNSEEMEIGTPYRPSNFGENIKERFHELNLLTPFSLSAVPTQNVIHDTGHCLPSRLVGSNQAARGRSVAHQIHS